MTSTSRYEQWDIRSSVGLTALGVAAGRAVETGRGPDALLHDPWAERFIARAQPPAPMPTTPDEAASAGEAWTAIAHFMGVRSRFFDEYFTAATDAGVDQVVLLAAGLDARAYRLSWPSACHLYEVDQPKVLEFKDTVLDEAGATAGCTRHAVATDLREDWAGALQQAGFDPSRPTAWLAEGLLPYLPAVAEEQLIDRVDELSAPGSRIAVEAIRDMTAVVNHAMFDRDFDKFGVDVRDLWNDEPRQPIDDRLRAHGWGVDIESVREATQRFGRSLDSERLQVIGDQGVLMSGSRN